MASEFEHSLARLITLLAPWTAALHGYNWAFNRAMEIADYPRMPAYFGAIIVAISCAPPAQYLADRICQFLLAMSPLR